MDYKARFNRIKQYVQKRWFNIALIVLAAMLVLNKDLSIRFNIKAPLQNEKASMPGTKHPTPDNNKGKSVTKVTENLGSNASKPKTQGAIADAFSLFTPPSIPDLPDHKATEPDYEVNSVSPEQVNSFVKRFGDVARNEMTKFKVPASIILAQSLLASHAGVNQVAKTANNYFGIPCNSSWHGETIQFTGLCFRKYETAWFSFRDHSKYVTTGNFKHLTNLDPADYQRWAKGLELAGYNNTPGYSQMLIQTIQEFELDKFDH